jgi:hypothetical protein
MPIEPYEKGLVSFREIAGTRKRRVVGEIVAVTHGKQDKREMNLIFPMTRCLPVHQIHELLMTDEQDAGPGKIVNSVAVLGFFEVKTGGLIRVGDQVSIGGRAVGEIAGYNETHMPNHMNIIIKAEKKWTGIEMGLEPGYEIVI